MSSQASFINRDVALLVLRLTLGLVFLDYGWHHLLGVSAFTDAFANRFHIPLAELSAPLVAGVELFGGLAAVLGIFTRHAGFLLAITMIVSTLQVKLPAGLAQGRDPLGLIGFWDLDLSLFAIGIALLLMGSGRLSLAWLLFRREI
jgi:putative oxidoreductase